MLGTEHPHALMTRHNLAATYKDAGLVAEAIAIHFNWGGNSRHLLASGD